MKARHLFLFTVWLLSIQVYQLTAQPFRVKAYKMTVLGTSTLHEWESAVEKIECKGSFTLGSNSLGEVKDIIVKIPVTAIKSTKGRMMDTKTWEAFNYEKNPSIQLTARTRSINDKASTIDLIVNLSMAGVTRTIELTVAYKILPNGDLQITGSKRLAMSDFKMEPPTAMMGTIKVGNEVTVSFDFVLTNTNTI